MSTTILRAQNLGIVSFFLSVSFVIGVATAGKPLAVDQEVPSVQLPIAAAGGDSADDETIDLAAVGADGKAVVMFLRGFPGYQCPLCSRQVSAWIKRADDFRKADIPVVFVYPGPNDQLHAKAEEFLRGTTLPAGMTLVLDPDYRATEAFGVRWDAPRETAYPSTFVIENGKVTKANVSRSHAGRTDPSFAL